MADEIIKALELGWTDPWELNKVVEGLSYIDYILHRFTIEEGFFHA